MSNTLAPSKSVTSRDSKGCKLISIVAAAYDKAGLSDNEAQRVNETPGLSDLVTEFIAVSRLADRFKDEEVWSDRGYLSGYRNPTEISDQIDVLRSHWPQLNPDPVLRYMREAYGKLQIPDWVEGPFLWIRPGFFSNQCGEELTEVLKVFVKVFDGKFTNYLEGKLGPEHFRQSQRTLTMLRTLVEQQPCSDLLVVPGQFGFRHRGRSVRRARELFGSGEYGIGAKDGATMLITNPNRLQNYKDLWIDLSGDERSSLTVDSFDFAPIFLFDEEQIELGHGSVGYADKCGGSASVFVAQ